MTRGWLLITVSTPPGGTSTLRVYAWRNLRSLGAHYLQQSVCLLPATPKTTRAAARLVTRLRTEGGHGEMLRIHLTDSKQEAAVIDAIQRERTDECHEVVESTGFLRGGTGSVRKRGAVRGARRARARQPARTTRRRGRKRLTGFSCRPGG